MILAPIRGLPWLVQSTAQNDQLSGMQALCVRARILSKGSGVLSSRPDFSFSFPTSAELSPGFVPIFHSLQIFALPQILLTCPAFVFPSVANTLKYPLDKAFPH